jgi:hypothetical protein
MIHFFKKNYLLFIVSFALIQMAGCKEPIDRFALVNRHNITVTHPDTLASLSVGNGEFTYTADITGMQTFFEEYENGISLGTQSQWGWHTIPTDSLYTIEDVVEYYESCNDQMVPYAIQQREGRAARAANWLRSNPHRLHLGIIGLDITKDNGEKIALADLQNPKQNLDLWTGILSSEFEIDGEKVFITTVAHQEEDLVAFKIVSSLIQSGQVKIKIRFPYGKECHVCPGYDWENSDRHSSEVINTNSNQSIIHRTLDSTRYFTQVNWTQSGQLVQPQEHQFELIPNGNGQEFEFSVSFSRNQNQLSDNLFSATEANSKENWETFWTSGGAVDFSNCTDTRALELERRVVLSQYLVKIQCSGSQPPQETGLTFNSWYGKFHMEMHWWHAAQFAFWGRPQYLENSMGWYFDNLENARATAQRQGYSGVRWQKMTTPLGQSSPSSVGEYLVWQQPHIIYFAELLYSADPSDVVLKKYQELVFETADFMASFAQLDPEDGKYHLCPPLIPAQEHFRATETSDPAFELSYWYWGLRKAQEWRTRLGIAPEKNWQQVIDNLAPLPDNDNYYLPTREAADAFTNFDKRRDHPIVIGAFGMLPNDQVDINKMANTFDEIMHEWDWQSTWGWDYPMLAMSAARLGKPEQAIEALFTETQKNTYLINGHNYQSPRLRIYLPGNGGLLSAVAMMAAGFEGAEVEHPGFPKDGSWDIRWEGLEPLF